VKASRRQARELALQALYAWQLSGGDPLDEAESLDGYEINAEFTRSIVRGVRDRAEHLRGLITPHIDRPFERLSPVERAILYIAAFELGAHPETPFKVVLNEAVELGKSFGATEGHRFVNGVLEKVAAALRPEEVAKARRIA
jgi:transcription antitermination protein NusB